MALKKKIAKEDFDKLSDAVKEQYKQVGEDYLLDIDGDEDTGALKRAKDHEVKQRKEAEKKLKELEDKLEELQTDPARKAGDVAALENSWKDKLSKAEQKYQEKLTARDKQLQNLLVDNKAQEIAQEISTSPKLILPHIQRRLHAELDGEEAITRVLDASGKPSAASLDDLKKEFVANKDFASIIIASKATGGGASGQSQSGGGASGKKLTELNYQERMALQKENPEEFNRMAEAVKAEVPNNAPI